MSNLYETGGNRRSLIIPNHRFDFDETLESMNEALERLESLEPLEVADHSSAHAITTPTDCESDQKQPVEDTRKSKILNVLGFWSSINQLRIPKNQELS